MMIGAFLISIMLSVGNGLKQFMISQVTMFADTRTIGVQKQFDFGSFGFSLGGGVEKYTEPSDALEVDVRPLDEGTSSDTSGMPDYLSGAVLRNNDLEKISKINHVADAAFEKYISPDYIRLDDAERDKLLVTLYGLPVEIRENASFSVVDKNELRNKDAVVLSDGYAESWGLDRELLLGKTVWIQVAQTGEPSGLGSVQQGGMSAGHGDVEIKEFPFKIAGFVEKSLLSQMGYITPEAADEIGAYIAGKSIEELITDEKEFEIIVIVDSDENVDAVDRAIEKAGYQSMTYDESIGQIGVVFDFISAALSSFGAIAMLVASIGIANTLLMAIYERTREIGVMKAVGATRTVIGALFTAEAAWLGILGGSVGLLVSWLIGRFVNWILHDGISIGSLTILKGVLADYPTFDISVFNIQIIILVLGVTTSVAVVAGLYPAWRASRLDPIVALRHD